MQNERRRKRLNIQQSLSGALNSSCTGTRGWSF